MAYRHHNSLYITPETILPYERVSLTNSRISTKTPLEMLAATCESIGQSPPPTFFKPPKPHAKPQGTSYHHMMYSQMIPMTAFNPLNIPRPHCDGLPYGDYPLDKCPQSSPSICSTTTTCSHGGCSLPLAPCQDPNSSLDSPRSRNSASRSDDRFGDNVTTDQDVSAYDDKLNSEETTGAAHQNDADFDDNDKNNITDDYESFNDQQATKDNIYSEDCHSPNNTTSNNSNINSCNGNNDVNNIDDKTSGIDMDEEKSKAETDKYSQVSRSNSDSEIYKASLLDRFENKKEMGDNDMSQKNSKVNESIILPESPGVITVSAQNDGTQQQDILPNDTKHQNNSVGIADARMGKPNKLKPGPKPQHSPREVPPPSMDGVSEETLLQAPKQRTTFPSSFYGPDGIFFSDAGPQFQGPFWSRAPMDSAPCFTAGPCNCPPFAHGSPPNLHKPSFAKPGFDQELLMNSAFLGLGPRKPQDGPVTPNVPFLPYQRLNFEQQKHMLIAALQGQQPLPPYFPVHFQKPEPTPVLYQPELAFRHMPTPCPTKKLHGNKGKTVKKNSAQQKPKVKPEVVGSTCHWLGCERTFETNNLLCEHVKLAHTQPQLAATATAITVKRTTKTPNPSGRTSTTAATTINSECDSISIDSELQPTVVRKKSLKNDRFHPYQGLEPPAGIFSSALPPGFLVPPNMGPVVPPRPGFPMFPYPIPGQFSGFPPMNNLPIPMSMVQAKLFGV